MAIDKDLIQILSQIGPAGSARAAGEGFERGVKSSQEARKEALRQRIEEAGILKGSDLNNLIPALNAPAEREFKDDVIQPLALMARAKDPNEAQRAKIELQKAETDLRAAGEKRRREQFEFEKEQRTKPSLKQTDRDALNTINEVALNLQDIAENYSPGFTGFSDNLTTGAKQFTGIGANDKASTFRQATSALRNVILKARSGAAVTPSEAQRLMSELPDAKFSDQDFVSRFNNTVRKFNQLIESRRKTYENVQDVPELFTAPSIESTAQETPPPSADSFIKDMESKGFKFKGVK